MKRNLSPNADSLSISMSGGAEKPRSLRQPRARGRHDRVSPSGSACLPPKWTAEAPTYVDPAGAVLLPGSRLQAATPARLIDIPSRGGYVLVPRDTTLPPPPFGALVNCRCTPPPLLSRSPLVITGNLFSGSLPGLSLHTRLSTLSRPVSPALHFAGTRFL